ncbi:nucleotidyltransferase [Caldisalinibacter kiritimatiensis]|uniref:tRNA(Met) cytidine acetate ligase n=1 Tax=Caldisalinibacter kiritimatiensis TaxID=1304284 RepID=R1AW03_9FIRM|nr:nucleotidyltransferase [Caldisalinibacter kiritimatiensis]EOD00822.1 hypothetical protein L21TH_1122 [Caldisalinibacter kiritimatiensis]
MKIVGLITEYNPFHNGHLYHLEKSKEITECSYSVVVMSGNFVQRGEPAIVDKWTRAKMAVDNGVDLVIELPTVYAVQSAEFFAYGAIKTLDSLGIIDSVVFGSENGNIEALEEIADVLITEPTTFKEYLKNSLNKGNTYPVARSKALEKYFKSNKSFLVNDLSKVLSSPNNILGIEYLKALKKVKSTIKPYTINRIGAGYHDKKLKGNLASASAIRNQIINSSNLNKISNVVPEATVYYLNNFLDKYNSFNNLENYTHILLYLIRFIEKKEISNILDVEEGLENRIIKCGYEKDSISEIIKCIKTKRYTYTRLQRILLHILLKISGNSFLELHKHGPQYIRVLASNQKGLTILKKIKENSNIPIITKFANYQKLKKAMLNRMIEYDINATNLYFLGLTNYNGVKTNLDFLTSPYIKTK